MAPTTTYLALLRGINVGGNNLIKMEALRECFERNGFSGASTYIQSGNVFFRSGARDLKRLTRRVERMLSEEFSYEARAVVLSDESLRGIVERAPKGFGDQPDTYLCDVIFLMPPLDAAQAMNHIEEREGIDRAWPGDGVVYYQRLKARASGSRLSKFAGSPTYAEVTVRSWSTTSKLLAKLDELTP
jgi:uncharacterized protein (DUF1697 family)